MTVEVKDVQHLHETARKIHKTYVSLVNNQTSDSLVMTALLDRWQDISGLLLEDLARDPEFDLGVDVEFIKLYHDLIVWPIQVLWEAVTERLCTLMGDNLADRLTEIQSDVERHKDRPVEFAKYVSNCINRQFETLEDLTKESYPRIEI